jgi:LysM repeat protein
VTDETPEKRTRRPRPASPDDVPPPDVAPGDVEDPDDALRRLESMGSAKPADGVAPLPPAPAVDSFGAPLPSRKRRATGPSERTPRSAPRPAAGSRSTRVVARVAAPIVFLVAVIALVGIVVNSGVMSSDEPTTTPTAKATKAGGSTSTTKKYVVKSGDSLSSIAVRFNTTTSELQSLNPDLGNTLVVGTRIVVPRQ